MSGQAVGPYTMVAPITGRACYYYRTLVWEWKQSGKNKAWVKVAGERMHLPFFVDDNTGRLLVDPRGADLDLHCDFKEEFCDSFFTTKDAAPANVHSFLSRHGIVTSNKIKVEEYCIKPKNSLFLLGTLGENPGIEVGPQPVQDAETLNSFSSGRLSLSSNLFSFSVHRHDDDFDTGSSIEPFATPSNTRHEVIRLSPEGAPVKSSEMSQQQKISAALLKAGTRKPRDLGRGRGAPSGDRVGRCTGDARSSKRDACRERSRKFQRRASGRRLRSESARSADEGKQQ